MQGLTFLLSQLSFARAKMGYGKLPPFSKPPQSPLPITDSVSQANESIIFMCVLHKKFPSDIIIYPGDGSVNQILMEKLYR